MIITSVEQYIQIKAKLEEIGFTNVPAPDNLDFSDPTKTRLNASLQFRHKTVQDDSIGLQP